MSFIRQVIEKKLSAATGGAVVLGDFKFSPMSGTIELLQLRIAAERFVPPFLSIDRIEAKVAVARALRGEIAIKSLIIERPTLIVNIHADGKTNLPNKPKKEEAIVAKEGSAAAGWEINADKITLTGGRLEFRDATRNNYKLAIEGINASVTPEGQDLTLMVTADSVGRRDKSVDLGVVKILAKLAGGGFRDPLASSLGARASIADAIVVQINSTMIANRLFDIEAAGAMKLATLVGMLPIGMAQIWALNGDGAADLRTKFTLELNKHVGVSNFELKAGGFSINRTFGHFAGDGLHKQPQTAGQSGATAQAPPPPPVPAAK